MLIDWFTVGAQALNFVILVWLMKHFLYQPVLDAIAGREKRIADQIADASAKEAQATAQRQTFEDKNTAFDQQRAGLLAQASEEAKARGEQLVDAAHKAADASNAQRQEALKIQAEQLKQNLGERARQEVFAIARKTLSDLATVSLEERIGEVFTRRLRELPDPAKATLGEALKASAEPARVCSTFELPAEQRAAIQNAFNETFSAEVRLRFERADTVCGIELSVGGQKLAWSIDGYLKALETSVADLLAPPAKPSAASPAQPATPAASPFEHKTVPAPVAGTA